MARHRKVKNIRKQCDVEFSKLIRAKGVCEKCGKIESLQCAHVISRTNLTLRFDIFNGLCLCGGCHIFWAHRNPLEFTEWFKNTYPERYDYLMEVKDVLLKRKEADYLELLDNLKSRRFEKLILTHEESSSNYYRRGSGGDILS